MNGRPLPACRATPALWALASALVFCACVAPLEGADVGIVSLFDGERTDVVGGTRFLNNWGGGFLKGNIASIARDASVARSGSASIRADLGTIAAGGFGFFQTFSSELSSLAQRQTRDMTRFQSFEAFVRNDTGTALNLKLEIKDYRDDLAHQAFTTFAIPAGGGWTRISAPLDATLSGWTVVGSPDLSRTYANSFVVTPQSCDASGRIYIDDFSFQEARGSLDSETAPIRDLAERLAERQFSGLWTARNRTTGLIYNTSNDADLAAMNTTGGVLWMLPAAVKRGWTTQAEADAFAGRVAASLNANRNLTTYLPTRFIRPATAALPGGENEESTIDASFIALALHHYKSQPTTSPELASTIDAVQNRFRFDAFSRPQGFNMAFRPAMGFAGNTYDGYTNEGKVISLAASVADEHRVPLAERWNTDTHRARVWLVNQTDAHLVHDINQFRAPFEQALLNLFVDTSQRGVDSYPVRSLATNPWENFVRYERETAARLTQRGRAGLFQLDAGLGFEGNGGYQQYSEYNTFGQSDLFMPWSVSLALLAGADGAEQALRTFLGNSLLHGPLGLADSARWANGASGPRNVPAHQDNWNVVLSTMALLEYLQGADSASRFFSRLPEIDAELDTVFVNGDVDGDGDADGQDLSFWSANWGRVAGATPNQGDVDGDGAVDGDDFLRWQRGFSAANGSASANVGAQAVPEPDGRSLVLSLLGVYLTVQRVPIAEILGKFA